VFAAHGKSSNLCIDYKSTGSKLKPEESAGKSLVFGGVNPAGKKRPLD
jgi:hypothetical protein